MNFKSLVKKVLIRYFKLQPVVNVSICYVNPSERFCGKNVLVTGGTSGIGFAIAKRFLLKGANVVVSARHHDALIKLKEQFGNKRLHTIVWDVADVNLCKEKILEIVSMVGPIDVFVNNAGVSIYEGFVDSPEQYDYIHDVNQKGLYFLNKYEGNYYIEQGIHGKIINITSDAGDMHVFESYYLSKGGANYITKANAQRLAPYHINVNAVAPGCTPTNITKELQSHIGDSNLYHGGHMTKRFTLPEEIAAAVAFLASGEANNICGQIINVNGSVL